MAPLRAGESDPHALARTSEVVIGREYTQRVASVAEPPLDQWLAATVTRLPHPVAHVAQGDELVLLAAVGLPVKVHLRDRIAAVAS